MTRLGLADEIQDAMMYPRFYGPGNISQPSDESPWLQDTLDSRYCSLYHALDRLKAKSSTEVEAAKATLRGKISIVGQIDICDCQVRSGSVRLPRSPFTEYGETLLHHVSPFHSLPPSHQPCGVKGRQPWQERSTNSILQADSGAIEPESNHHLGDNMLVFHQQNQ